MKLSIKNNPKIESRNLSHLIDLVGGDWILVPSIKTIRDRNPDKLLVPIREKHKANKEKIKKLKLYYNNLWKEVGKDYIKEIENIFGHKIKMNKKVFLVTSIWVNLADVIGRKNAYIVAEKNQQNPLDFIFLHELTHLFYSDEITKFDLFEDAGKSPLMEGVDHLILFKTPIRKLFTGVSYNEVKFVKVNRKFMNSLEKLWNNKKNFQTFLEEAIKLNKKTKNVVIC